MQKYSSSVMMAPVFQETTSDKALAVIALYKNESGKRSLKQFVPYVLSAEETLAPVVPDFTTVGLNLSEAGMEAGVSYSVEYMLWNVSGLTPLASNISVSVAN